MSLDDANVADKIVRLDKIVFSNLSAAAHVQKIMRPKPKFVAAKKNKMIKENLILGGRRFPPHLAAGS